MATHSCINDLLLVFSEGNIVKDLVIGFNDLFIPGMSDDPLIRLLIGFGEVPVFMVS
jgi:hypothetical protein